MGTDISQNDPYQKNMGDEEGFQIHTQSQQACNLGRVGRGVVLQEQNAASQFPSPLACNCRLNLPA